MNLINNLNTELAGKIDNVVLQKTSNAVNFNVKKNNLLLDLASKKMCMSCPNKKYTDIVLPVLNRNSSVLFIFSTLDGYDKQTGTFFGKGSRLLYSIIDYLKIDSYSITSVLKCGGVCNKNCYELCHSFYTSREIDLVKPKKIICFGVSACNVIKEMFVGDSTTLIQNEDMCTGTDKVDDIDILYTLDLNNVLSFTGKLLVDKKRIVWNDVVNFLDKD